MTGGWCTWHWELPTLPFFGACLEATVSLMRSNGGFAPRYDQRILQACPEQSAELVQRWEIAHFRANWSGNKQKLIRKWLVYFFSWGNWWFVMMMNQWILRFSMVFPKMFRSSWPRYFADCGFSSTFEDTLAESIEVTSTSSRQVIITKYDSAAMSRFRCTKLHRQRPADPLA